MPQNLSSAAVVIGILRVKDKPNCMFGRVQLHLWKGLPKVATIMLIWQNFMDLTLGKLVLIDKYFP